MKPHRLPARRAAAWLLLSLPALYFGSFLIPLHAESRPVVRYSAERNNDIDTLMSEMAASSDAADAPSRTPSRPATDSSEIASAMNP